MDTRSPAGADAGNRNYLGDPAQTNPDRPQQQDLKQQGQAAMEQAREVAGQAREKAAEFAGQAKAAVGQTADQTRRKVGEYADQARQHGAALVDQQRQKAAGTLHTVGDAAHRAAEKFRESHDDNIAGYVDALADEVHRCAGYLERQDLGRLTQDAQNFARRRPEWFLGGMFVAGLALTRFLKASAERNSGGAVRYPGHGTSGHGARPQYAGSSRPTDYDPSVGGTSGGGMTGSGTMGMTSGSLTGGGTMGQSFRGSGDAGSGVSGGGMSGGGMTGAGTTSQFDGQAVDAGITSRPADPMSSSAATRPAGPTNPPANPQAGADVFVVATGESASAAVTPPPIPKPTPNPTSNREVH